jgi:thymidylate synthase
MSSYRYYGDLLTAGDPKSPVAIVTLWTISGDITKDIKPGSFATAGQLYTKNGINYLVRNLLADKHIRYLIVCGQDRSGSGAETVKLWETGRSDFLHKEIHQVSLKNLITNVKLINLIDTADGKIVAAEIAGLDTSLAAYGEPEEFPEPENKQLSELECSWPSDTSVFKVSGATIAETWLKVMKTVLRFGDIKLTDSMKMKEAANLAAVITDENANDFFLPGWLGLDKEKVDAYLPQIVGGEKIAGLHYTYGNRLQEHFKINQVERMINRLNEDANAREAVGVLFDPHIDFDAEHRPCIILIQALKNHGLLHLNAYVRSHDVFGGWPLNAFGLRKLQQNICDRTGSRPGPLTIFSASAHIYDFNWAKALELSDSELKDEFENDPRGYYKIETDKGKKEIIVEHFSPDGLKLQMFSENIEHGDAAKRLLKKINKNLGVSLLPHAAYLGVELTKAEMALRLGTDYRQDAPLPLVFTA